ncbi:MAG: DUF2961 domain-containing protein [Chitinophagaceae bacterium]|nr:DUF2961 domain-containing protein [Chitinophagaceae bacterium]
MHQPVTAIAFFPFRTKHIVFVFLVSVFNFSCHSSTENKNDTEPYQFKKGIETRWSSPENPNGEKGAGGKINFGAKGRPFIVMDAATSLDLLNVKGQGVIRRIWLTFSRESQNPVTLRSLKLDMYWDGESKPAVSVPLGDFFGVGLGKQTIMENVFFADPEGRSFNCFIPMPFRTGARIVLINESEKTSINLFYDIDYTLSDHWNDNNLYFHAYWHRDTATVLSEDFEVLPKVTGKGRFLGSNIGVNANPRYETTWFGEGEVKIYTDGDKNLPTLIGTGTEDYIGDAWGQKKFIQQYTGCTIADTSLKQWAFYRYHVVDPIYFDSVCKVTIQQMGGAYMAKTQRFQASGVPLIPVVVGDDAAWTPVYKKGELLKLDTTTRDLGWITFYRSDDVSAVAYFYLDKPSNMLPGLQSLSMRTVNLR